MGSGSLSLEVGNRFAPDYRAQFGVEPDATATLAYDAAMLMAGLASKAGDKPVHRSFPIAGQELGASGNLKYSPSGDRLVPLELLEYRDGTFAPSPPPKAPDPSPADALRSNGRENPISVRVLAGNW